MKSTPKTQQTTVKDTTPDRGFERGARGNLPTALTDPRPPGSGLAAMPPAQATLRSSPGRPEPQSRPRVAFGRAVRRKRPPRGIFWKEACNGNTTTWPDRRNPDRGAP